MPKPSPPTVVMSANRLSAEEMKELYNKGSKKHDCKHFGRRKKETANASRMKRGGCGKLKHFSREFQVVSRTKLKQIEDCEMNELIKKKMKMIIPFL